MPSHVGGAVHDGELELLLQDGDIHKVGSKQRDPCIDLELIYIYIYIYIERERDRDKFITYN